jgi:hypothetical protein
MANCTGVVLRVNVLQGSTTLVGVRTIFYDGFKDFIVNKSVFVIKSLHLEIISAVLLT